MGSIFQGTPQTATSYASSTSQTPQWMQDAIYNQVQWAQNAANTPYQSYNLPTVAGLSPLQQQSEQAIQGAQGQWKPALSAAEQGTQNLAGQTTAGTLQDLQSQYLNPGQAGIDLTGSNNMFNQSGQATAQSLQGSALGAAAPYLQNAGQSSADTVGSYMSPYMSNVTDTIAKLGQRNLQENIMPGISDAFIKAGGFGSSRMGTFGERAARDTNESILNAQSQALQSGYGQALNAAGSDLSRQGTLASTAGNLGATDLSRILQAGAQYGTLGSALAGAGATQQQLGLTGASALQGAQAGDISRGLSGLQQYANMAQQGQGLAYTDASALDTAGQEQQNTNQNQLTAAYQQWQNQLNYPKSQLDWLNNEIRGIAPSVPTTTTQSTSTTGGTYSASPLSQLASGLFGAKALSSALG